MADKTDQQNHKEAVEIDYSDLFKHRKKDKKGGDKPAERGGRDSDYNGFRR